MLRIWLCALFCITSLSCRSAPSEPTAGTRAPGETIDRGCNEAEKEACHQAPLAEPVDKTPGTKLYGAPVGTSPQVALTEVLRHPEKFKDTNVIVSGHVKRACSRKGCWMELAVDATKESVGCRVKFKDYGFFVPTDAQGSEARLEGLVQVTTVEPNAVLHYESEGATFPSKAPDGSAKEVRFVATGVELTRG